MCQGVLGLDDAQPSLPKMLIIAVSWDGAAEVGDQGFSSPDPPWDEEVPTSGLCRWVLWMLIFETGIMTHRPTPVGRPACQGQDRCIRIVALWFSPRQLTFGPTLLIRLRASFLQTKDIAASTRGQSPSTTWLELQNVAEVRSS